MRRTPRAEDTKAAFDHDGYAVVRDFLSPDRTAQLAADMDSYISGVLPSLAPNAAFYEDKSRPETLFRLDGINRHDPDLADRWLRWDPILDLARRLLNDDVAPHAMSMFGKAPRVGNQTPPHQDGYYFMLEPNEAITVWLPLDRTDQGNGCIRYVPGSHARGLRPHGKSEVFGFSQGLLDFSEEDRQREVAITADPGDLIAHHSLTIHRADPNLSDRRRWAVGLVYYAARARVNAEAQRAYHEHLLKEYETEGKT